MKCTCYVQGGNVTELRTNAETMAAEFADGGEYTLTWPDDVHAYGWIDETAEPSKRFSASVTITVPDPKPASS